MASDSRIQNRLFLSVVLLQAVLVGVHLVLLEWLSYPDARIWSMRLLPASMVLGAFGMLLYFWRPNGAYALPALFAGPLYFWGFVFGTLYSEAG